MLGFLLVKSVGSRNKIIYGKIKLAGICDVAKGERMQTMIIFFNYHSYFCICFKWQSYSLLNDILQEYSQFHIYDIVPSTKNFLM